MEENPKGLHDYLAILRRRKVSIILTAALILSASLLAAMLWPPTYRSTATILIEEQDIPPDLIRSTITSYAAQRIEVISQRVMTRANLLNIIEKFGLYPEQRKWLTASQLVERMREDTSLQTISADVIDPRSNRPTQATIAFTLSFEGRNPAVVQKVATELTSLYLNENLKNRTEKAAETSQFLTEEANRLKRQIDVLTTALAEFKEKNVNQLPDLKQLNLQLMERTERELADTDNQIRALEERKFYLEAQLAQIKPTGPIFSASGERILGPEDRLKALQTEYLSAVAKYSADYPDVLALKREIDALKKATGAIDDTAGQRNEIERLRATLVATREKYTEDHPDVVKLERSIAALEAALRQAQRPPKLTPVSSEGADNPIYVNLKSQLEAVNSDLRALQVRRMELKAKLADFEGRLMQTPQVEREYLTLTRDYDNAVLRYREITAKQMEAEVAQQLEKERKGERFSLIDPPVEPEKPIKPNRPAIVFLGAVLSLAGGVGFGSLREALDGSIRGVRGIISILGIAPLAVIPYLENQTDVRRRRRVKALVLIGITTCLAVALLLMHYFWMPLDVLWFKGLRSFEVLAG